MEIKLKNIYRLHDLTEKGEAFISHLYIAGYKVGVAGDMGSDDGTFYTGYDERGCQLIKEAEDWCETFGMDLEEYIVALLFEHIEQKEREQFRNKMKKEMVRGILIGIPNSDYRVIHLSLPINTLLSNKKGIEDFKISIRQRVIPQLQMGEKILNTNISDSIVRALEIMPWQIVGR